MALPSKSAVWPRSPRPSSAGSCVIAAEQLGAAVDFPSTEALRNLALAGRAGQKLQLAQGFRAERTARELRLAVLPLEPASTSAAELAPEYTVAIPGEVAAPAFGLRLRIERMDASCTKPD